jgi:thymidylate kinase
MGHSANRQYLPGVIAVVGSDGSGKSTLSADLVARLSAERETAFLYLGQSSGNILTRIRGLPLIGEVIGRFLVRRSQRVHAEESRSAAPDLPSALVVHLLSRWRNHKFGRMLAMNRRGVVVVTDRYPQAEVPGFYFDGPGLDASGGAKGLVRWLTGRELHLYRRMISHVPALVIRLNIDADTAHRRKPDHKLAMLRDKTRVIPRLQFNGARILDLDSTEPYPQMLSAALAGVRDVLGDHRGGGTRHG